jgi:hypothetical protein
MISLEWFDSGNLVIEGSDCFGFSSEMSLKAEDVKQIIKEYNERLSKQKRIDLCLAKPDEYEAHGI